MRPDLLNSFLFRWSTAGVGGCVANWLLVIYENYSVGAPLSDFFFCVITTYMCKNEKDIS